MPTRFISIMTILSLLLSLPMSLQYCHCVQMCLCGCRADFHVVSCVLIRFQPGLCCNNVHFSVFPMPFYTILTTNKLPQSTVRLFHLPSSLSHISAIPEILQSTFSVFEANYSPSWQGVKRELYNTHPQLQTRNSVSYLHRHGKLSRLKINI